MKIMLLSGAEFEQTCLHSVLKIQVSYSESSFAVPQTLCLCLLTWIAPYCLYGTGGNKNKGKPEAHNVCYTMNNKVLCH